MKNTEYAMRWIEGARKELENDSEKVFDYIDNNYSGGLHGWEDLIVQIYYEPKTLEEWFLQAEVHKVLLLIAEKIIIFVDRSQSGKPAYLRRLYCGELFCLYQKTKSKDPLLAIRNKIGLNNICKRYLQSSLQKEINEGFGFIYIASDFVW